MNDFDFLETNDRIRRLRKPPRQQIAGMIALITVGFAGVLLLGAWSAYQFHFKPLPATPSVKPAPVVEVAPRPAAPSPSKADLAEIERQRNADEFVAKVAAILRRPEPEPDSIPGNAVP